MTTRTSDVKFENAEIQKHNPDAGALGRVAGDGGHHETHRGARETDAELGRVLKNCFPN